MTPEDTKIKYERGERSLENSEREVNVRVDYYNQG